MVWIVALSAAWVGAFVMLLALTSVAARSDRPTAEHLAARMRGAARGSHGRARAAVWLPPGPERDL